MACGGVGVPPEESNESLFGRALPRDPVLLMREYDQPRTLLYVEDTPATVQVITAILSRRPSITVLSASTGSEGLEMARIQLPDLVLLDLDLPDMQGDAVLRALLSDRSTREIPVVILSADATARQFDRLLRLGARAYLTKPAPMRTLLETVDRHIEPILDRVPSHPRTASAAERPAD